MKKRSARKIKVGIAIVLAFLTYVWFSASRLIISAVGDYFAFSVSNCAYASIDECLKNDYIVSFCKTEKDNQGKIVCITTDALKVNTLSVALATECYNRLESLINSGFDIPCGVFSGIRILSGQGECVKIKLAHVLSVQCDMIREFISAGINQTRLLFTVVIHANINIYTPMNTKCFDVKIQVPIYDSIIIGEVPEVYLNSETIGSWKKT